MGGKGSGGHRRGSGRKKKQVVDDATRKQRQEAMQQSAARMRERNAVLLAEQQKRDENDINHIRETLTQVAKEVCGISNDRHEGEDNGVIDEADDADDDYDGLEDVNIEPSSDTNENNRSAGSGSKEKKRNGRQLIKPKEGTPLYKHLFDYMYTRLLEGDLKEKVDQGQTWFMPEVNASTMYTNSPTHDPQVFACEGRCVIYVHLPHLQVPSLYGTAVLKTMECLYCKKVGYLESNIFDFRAGFTFGPNLTTWIFHRRVVCRKKNGGCGKSCAEIDPHFLSHPKMDTRIVERFPFITTVRGPAVHEHLLNAYLELATSSTSIGTFVSMYNTLRRQEYWKETSSYYNHAVSWVESRVETSASRIPGPFPPFESNGNYNGFMLPLSLFRHIVVRAVKQLETYLQKSFLPWHDEGAIADHSFKFPNLIKNSIHGGKLFGAAYLTMSQMGMITMNPLLMTKSNQELDPVLCKQKEARDACGAPKLKRLELDGGSDIYAWKSVHKGELEDDVEEYVPPPRNDGLVTATIAADDYIYISNLHIAEFRVRDVMTELQSSELHEVVIGTDTENNMGQNELRYPRTLALSFPQNVYKPVLLFHLDAMGVTQDPRTFPNFLRKLLEHPKIVHSGVNISHDHDGLQVFGVKLHRMFELSELAKQCDRSIGTSVEKLAERFLKLSVDKRSQKYVDWRQSPLPTSLQGYAALDARLHLQLYWSIVASLETTPCILRESTDLKSDDDVDFLHSNKVAARVKVLFVAGQRGGEARKWGKRKIPSKHALVRLIKVIRPNVRAPMNFEAAETDITEGRNSWQGRTISQIFNSAVKEIVVPTARLSKPLKPIVQHMSQTATIEATQHPTSSNASVESTTNGITSTSPNALAGNGSTSTLRNRNDHPSTATKEISSTDHHSTGTTNNENEPRMETRGIEDPPGDGESRNNDAPRMQARSREKRDLFHVLKELPIPLKEPGRNLISRLLILASAMFDAEEYRDYADFLEERFSIPANKLLDNFYFNREKWRQHVRTYRPEAEHHAERINKVHQFVAQHIKALYNDEVRTYLEKFEQLCREGAFEESNDVDAFIFAGKDANGLNSWFRLWGSTRAENVHQKQKLAVGPWAIGAEFAHFLLLWTDFRYNVSTGIKRLNHHSFGMAHLYLIDLIQTQMIRLYGIDPFPRHVNISQLETLDDFVAVGIMPLWKEDTEFVDVGKEPHPELTGDLRFVAERMKVLCPPIHLATKEEWKIFKEFIRSKKQLGDMEWAELAKIFKERTNCIDIFPKLPSMLKSVHKKYQDNLKIKELEQEIGQAYIVLQNLLGKPVDSSAAGFGMKRQMDIATELHERLPTNNPNNVRPSTESHDQPVRATNFAAPGQQIFCQTTNEQKFRFCSRPGCKLNAYFCKGFSAAKCTNQEVDSLTADEIQIIENEKKQEKKKRKVDVELQRQKRKKSEK